MSTTIWEIHYTVGEDEAVNTIDICSSGRPHGGHVLDCIHGKLIAERKVDPRKLVVIPKKIIDTGEVCSTTGNPLLPLRCH